MMSRNVCTVVTWLQEKVVVRNVNVQVRSRDN